jgi:16S rRNA G1207 methylase RsmC
MGCGNGVLGICMQQRQPNANVQFIDESYSAIASARANYLSVFPEDEFGAEFVVADGWEFRADDSVDMALCNPPFHQQHALGDQVARSMFAGSKRCLVRGGELWVVANRHLHYLTSLKRLFGNCRLMASNRKFNVLRVIKR